MMPVSDVVTALGDLFLPRRCLVCGRVLGMRERHICLYCAADLPLTWYWQRTHNPMADRLNTRITGEGERYAYAAALFFYDADAGYRRIPQALKYDADLRAGRHFARQLGARLAGAGHFRNVDLVVPVPLHRSRRWQRGYNQAEVIAREVARCLHVPMRTDLLVRWRRTETQTALSVEEKAANVAGAFRTRGGCPARHILLVDDVFTTGATLAACIQALRAVCPAGEVRISAATLAAVEQKATGSC